MVVDLSASVKMMSTYRYDDFEVYNEEADLEKVEEESLDDQDYQIQTMPKVTQGEEDEDDKQVMMMLEKELSQHEIKILSDDELI